MAGYINNGGVVTANYEADGDMKSPWPGISEDGEVLRTVRNPLTGGIGIYGLENVGNNIAFIGDSRVRYGRRNWFKAATSADQKGMPIDLLGVDVGVTADTSGTLEYRSSDKSVRWTVSGDSAGAWTSVQIGRMYVESGAANKSLSFIVRSMQTMPATDQSVSVALAGSMYQRVGWDGYPNGAVSQIVSVLRNGPTEYYLGAGGATTAEGLELLSWWNSVATGPGVDVIRLGTNDISNNVDPAVTIANAYAIFDARRAKGRSLVICGESARYQISTTVLSGSQLTALFAINAAYRAYAEKYAQSCRYVDLFSLSADPNYTDGRPATNYLQDHVHDGPLGATAFGNAIAVAAMELGCRAAPYKSRGDANLFPTGWLIGTGGTIGAGASGQLPTGVTGAQKSGDTQMTGVCSVTQYADHLSNQATLALTNADAGASRRFDLTFATATLAALGLAVGDTVYFEADCEVTAGAGTSIEAYLFIYGGTSIRTQIDFPARVCGQCHGKSIPVKIPAGTTNVQFVVYVTLPASGSMTLKIGEIVPRKI